MIEPDDIDAEILRRRGEGELLADISAEMTIPIEEVRDTLQRYGQRTDRVPRQVVAPLPTIEAVLRPAPVAVAPKDLRLEALLDKGEKSSRQRVRTMAARVRREVDALRQLVQAEEREAAAKQLVERAAKELQEARQALKGAGAW